MLQYPLQLPPLSLSSSPKPPPKDNDYLRSNDQRFHTTPTSTTTASSNLLTKHFRKDSLVNRSPAISSPLAALSVNHAPSPPSISPSVNSIKLPRSPYISSRPLSTSFPVVHNNTANDSIRSYLSSGSSTVEDVLAPGDIVGEDCSLQVERIRLVSITSSSQQQQPQHELDDIDQQQQLAQEFEVVRRLGSGSYAVVYLVKEVLSRSPPSSEDGHMSTIGSMEFDGHVPRRPGTVYGREYAIKCLSKANLDEEALDAQLTEVRSLAYLCFLFEQRLNHISHSPGYHPSILALAPQHCHPSQDARNLLISTSSIGIRSWRRFVLFSGTGSRSL